VPALGRRDAEQHVAHEARPEREVVILEVDEQRRVERLAAPPARAVEEEAGADERADAAGGLRLRGKG
jgi:hypothetical protein